MNVQNLPFRLEQELVRRWHRVWGSRPTSAPYLSGDGFRSLSKAVYESQSRGRFSAQDLRAARYVFVEAWLLDEFFDRWGDSIPPGVKVLSSNGDPNFTTDRVAKIPDSVSVVWTQNLAVRHPKLRFLPIGLENAALHGNGIVADFERLRRGPAPNKNRILWGFAEVTNPAVRSQAKRWLETTPVADRLASVNSRAYRKILAQYRFVASPEGNGIDCHRTWEALYLRVVPIVLRSVATEEFQRLGLPLWIVDSYQELHSLTEDDLEERYRQASPGFDCPALWMDWWKKEILGG